MTHTLEKNKDDEWILKSHDIPGKCPVCAIYLKLPFMFCPVTEVGVHMECECNRKSNMCKPELPGHEHFKIVKVSGDYNLESSGGEKKC